MDALRNLKEKINGRDVFDIPHVGWTGAEINARSAAAAGDAGPGLLANDGLTDENRYSLRIVRTTIAPMDFVIRADGSGEVAAYGTIEYDIWETTPGGTMTKLTG